MKLNKGNETKLTEQNQTLNDIQTKLTEKKKIKLSIV